MQRVRGYYREVIDHLNTLRKAHRRHRHSLRVGCQYRQTAWYSNPGLTYRHLRPAESGTSHLSRTRLCGRPENHRYRHSQRIWSTRRRFKRISWKTKRSEDGYCHPRRPDTHKGDYGHLLVLAGSVGKTGAAAMACEAALRMGAGLVTLGIPKSLNAIMEVKLTEVMTEPLPETPKQTLSLRAFNAILRLCENKSAVIIGPGSGKFKETQSLIIKLIKTLNLPIILDADGLTALATQPKTLPTTNRSLILTPHPGEMARLIQSTPKEVQEDRIGISRNFSQSNRALSHPERASYLNRYSPGRDFHQPYRKSRDGLRRNWRCPHRNDRRVDLSRIWHSPIPPDVHLSSWIGRG